MISDVRYFFGDGMFLRACSQISDIKRRVQLVFMTMVSEAIFFDEFVASSIREAEVIPGVFNDHRERRRTLCTHA